jgi:hypothetical protein
MLKGAFIALAIGVGGAANACPTISPLELSQVLTAHSVVVGRAQDFSIIPNGDKTPLAASFKIAVQEVLTGDVSDRLDRWGMLPVTWFNGMGAPSTPRGHSVFVLRHPSAFEAARWIPQDRLTVLQQGCGPAHIFESSGDVAKGLRQVLDGEGDAEVELEVLEEFLFGKDRSGLY